jgi:hypothetical protein
MINKSSRIICIFLFQIITIVHAEVILDAFGSVGEDLYIKNMNCQNTSISFERKKDLTPLLQIGDYKNKLQTSCYSSMMCVTFNGQSSVLIIDSPACGGNGVPENYIVFNLKSNSKTSLTYNQAKKAKIVK